jgi:hypothetical protein
MTREKYQTMKKAHIISLKDDIFDQKLVNSTIISSRVANTNHRAKSTQSSNMSPRGLREKKNVKHEFALDIGNMLQ